MVTEHFTLDLPPCPNWSSLIVIDRLMHGDRPYWWVHEMEMAHNSSNAMMFQQMPAEIFQFQTTCETGPGMPSGHSMAMSAAWYVVIHAVVRHLVKSSNMR